MCDTWVALPDATESGQLIFAKNSDRPAFDCQPLVFQPRQTWPASARVTTEYVDLEQVPETYAHVGSRPYWSYGYEVGVNEHGVVIGNEAIFTRTCRAAATAHATGGAVARGLLGMDLIRLALERTVSACAAVELIGTLVQRYGQFGSAVPGKDHATGSYDNSFIVADPTEAWVVETAGRHWAARRLARGYTSISNQPTLRSDWDIGSPGLEAHAVAQGWWTAEAGARFDFARAYADEHVPRQVSHLRLMRSRQLLAERDGRITTDWMKRIARDHYEDTFLGGPLFNPADPDVLTLCMHDSPAGFTWGNTATSCVAVLPRTRGDVPVFWWTPGPPCNGCYVPFFVPAQRLPRVVSKCGTHGGAVSRPDRAPPDDYAANSYWWLFRRLLDRTTGGVGNRGAQYHERNRAVRERFDALETEFAAGLPAVLAMYAQAPGSSAGAKLLADFSDACVAKVSATAHELLAQFGNH